MSMSARKISKSWWVDLRYNHQRYRKRSPDNSKAGAEAYEAVLRHKLARGESPNDEHKISPTFAQFSQEWLNTYVQTNNKLSEQRTKASVLRNHLVPFFGKLELAQIRVEEIERYKTAEMGGGLVAKSINNHLAILRKCLRCAMEWGHIASMPFIRPLKVPPQKIDFLNETEHTALLSLVSDQLTETMVLTAAHTGMRMGELLGLEWSSVDFDKGQITVCRSIVRGEVSSPKSNRIRYIPMTSELKKKLYTMQRQKGLVFCREDGLPLTSMVAGSMLRRACDKAGIRRIGWHRLRHTFASRLVSRGASMRGVQQLLGHSTIVMTERYAHLAPSVLTDAIQLLENDSNGKIWATGGQRSIETMMKALFHEAAENTETMRV